MKFTAYVKALAVLILFFPLLSLALIAQAAPTPEQIQLFNQLSPAQKAEALKQINKQPTQTPAKTISQPQVVKPRPAPTDKAIEDIAKKGADAPDLDEPKQKKTLKVKQPLKQFGYDLFSGTPTTFAPATDIPIPSEYIVGPGDTVQVQLFGKDNAEYDLIVSREGQLRFPGIGPISVAGLRFDELKSNLRQRVKRQMIGVKANITMGALRSIRIFVLGDAIRPGSYTVSALSNMTNALFVSGGIKAIGSLRDIQLKRRGKIVTHFDLYDLLLNGDTSGDVRLQPGDVIFIPPIGKTVGIAGEVRRPAIYELQNEQKVGEVIAFAGGLLPTSYMKATQLERINQQGNRTLLDIDISTDTGLTRPVQDGDVIRIYSTLDKMDDIVLLSGHLQRPGGLQWHEGMRVTDVIRSANDLLPKPELRYALIKREVLPDRHIEAVTFNLGEALNNPQSKHNVILKPRDELHVFGQSNGNLKEKMAFIDALVAQLRDQARFNIPEHVVTITGNVRHPGNYPLSEGMWLSDLLKAAYDLKPQTDLDYALISREIESGERIRVFSTSLRDLLKEPAGKKDLQLMPRDQVYVFATGVGRQEQIEPIVERLKRQARYEQLSEVVSVSGLVMSPGAYPLDDNMRISELVKAAGGLTEAAYTLSAELSRYKIVEGEYREIEHFTVNQSDIYDGNVATDIVLTPYDHLQIKRLPKWADQRSIDIRGEVKFPGIYPFRQGETLYDVLKRAGGLTAYAFPEGAIFMREALRRKEQEQIETMSKRLEADLAVTDLEKPQSIAATKKGSPSTAMADTLLSQLRDTKAIGRLVIDLKTILEQDPDDEDKRQQISLKADDKLYIPPKTQEVTIIGEVQQATSHLYTPDKTRNDYINMSGGLTYKADDERIYIVRASGAVLSEENAGWFADEILPGDTIVVPLDADRIQPLTFWTNITQIIYQLGIAAAAWNTVGVF